MGERVEPRALLLCILALLPESGAGAENRAPERIDDPRIEIDRQSQPRAVLIPVIRRNHRSIQVNVTPLGEDIVGDAANEPSIAIDPRDPRRMVIGWRQFDTTDSNFREAGYAFSADGGLSWTFAGKLELNAFRSDPVLAADTDGTFLYYSLSHTLGPDVFSAELFLSEDGGATWSDPIFAHGGDKIWMTVDPRPVAGDAHIYATWGANSGCCGLDHYTRSTDGGLTFDGPLINPNFFPPNAGTLDVGPDGELYLVGKSFTSHGLMRSDSARDPSALPLFEFWTFVNLGGRTVADVLGSPNPGGLLGQVWVAADRSAGPTRGQVYVLGSVERAGIDPLDVMFVRSADRGVTWTAPLRIHDEPGGCYQWFGTMSVSPDGRIDVVWNESCGVSFPTEVRYAYSTDGGTTWSDGLPVTPSWDPFRGYPNQNKIGDYYHMVSDERGASLAFAGTFHGGQDVYFVRVGDCNANGRHDGRDIATGASGDCDTDGIPDECEEGTPCPACDGDGVCEVLEDCLACPGDCSAAECGNGVCEPSFGEDCLSCSADCNGQQTGTPSERFCCGDGAGQNPVDCEDRRCDRQGASCTDGFVCCGDGVCENGEICPIDCPAEDTDGDGVRDGLDCAPAGPAFAIPGEVQGLVFLDDKATLSWSTAAWTSGFGVGYDVLRGRLAELPVGGGPSEICAAADVTLARYVDAEIPPPNEGRYYLLRATNVCGSGGWGSDSSSAPRVTTVCGP